MTFFRIYMLIFGFILFICALFAIPFFMLGTERFLTIMPFLMAGLFAVIIVIVGIVFYRVFIGLGKKKEAIIATGEDAQATIVSMEDTGVTLQDGMYYQVKFGLEVRPATGPMFTASAKEIVSRMTVAQYQTGTVVQVKYNPRKHDEITIVGLAGAAPAAVKAAEGGAIFASDVQGASMRAPAQASRSSFSRGKMMAVIGVPVIISLLAGVAPLLILSKKDAVADYFIEKALGKYEITGATLVDHYTQPEKTVFKPKAGNKWLMATLTVKNTGDKELSNITMSQFKLVTGNGSEYSPNIVVDTGNDFDLRRLAPGDSYTGNIVYEVPEASVAKAFRNNLGQEWPVTAAV